jgi:hypothetical protein
VIAGSKKSIRVRYKRSDYAIKDERGTGAGKTKKTNKFKKKNKKTGFILRHNRQPKKKGFKVMQIQWQHVPPVSTAVQIGSTYLRLNIAGGRGRRYWSRNTGGTKRRREGRMCTGD